HAARPLCDHHSDARHRRVDDPQAAGPRHRGHLPDLRPALRHAAHPYRADPRRVDLLSRPRPWPHRGRNRAGGRAELLRHPMSKHAKTADLSGLYPAAIRESFTKLDPRSLWRNPVMFVTAVVAALTTVL